MTASRDNERSRNALEDDDAITAMSSTAPKGLARDKSLHPHRRTQPNTWIALVVCIAYLAVACLVFWPTGPLDATRLPGSGVGDPDEMTWFLSWTPWALFHGHNIFLSHAMDLPNGVNLANNTSVPLLGLLGSPVTALLGPIATLNVLLRVALASSAAGVFFVSRRWCTGNLGPFLSGALFAFSPTLVSHLQRYGHLDLVFLILIPIMVWLLDDILVSRRRSPRATGIALGLSAAGEYLISAELFADSALLVLIGLVAMLIAGRGRLADIERHTLVGLTIAALLFVVLAGYPIALALLGPNHLNGPVQSVAHLQRFRTDLAQLIIPDSSQWLLPNGLVAFSAQVTNPVTRAGGAAELGGYLGLPLVFSVVLLGIRSRRSRIVRFSAVMAVVSLVLSLGSRLQVAGTTTPVPLPEALIAKVPLFDSIVPARFSIFVMLFVVIILAVGVDEVVRDARSSERRRLAVPVLCALGVAASALVLAPRLPVAVEGTAESSSQAAAISALVPMRAIVLSYPYPDPPFALAMLWQARDDFSFDLLGGYANVRASSGAGQLFAPLVQPDYIQEFLAHSESGRRVHYPLPLLISTPVTTLCTFLRENHVSDVLYSPYGPGAAAVYALFQTALGAPTQVVGGFSQWDSAATAACGAKHP